MKYRHNIHKLIGCAAVALLATACTDWDEHYSVNENLASNSNKTLWEIIKADESLTQFAAVLEQAGYDEILTQDRVYTVWAPVGEFEYSGEDAELLVKEFVQNHIADYRHLGAGVLDETNGVKMLNGKRIHFTGSTGSYLFNDVNVVETNIAAKNGVLHRIGGNGEFSKFLPNIWEYLDKNTDISIFNTYLKEFTDSTINHTASEAGGSSINDLGQVEYADTVWSVSNVWWNRIGQLNNEDSTYIVIAPTDEAWGKMYEKVDQYLNYDSVQISKEQEGSPDSLQDLKVKEYMCRHLVFSQGVNPAPQGGVRDSLVSNYSGDRVVFRGEEYNALFANLVGDPIELSNGVVHVVDQLNYSPITCWLDTIKMQAENTNYCYEFNNKDGLVDDLVSYTVQRINQDSAFYKYVSGGSYMLAEERVATNVTLTYTLPNVYAAKYRIKVVVVPAIYQNPELVDLKPAPITMDLIYPSGDGKKGQISSVEIKNDEYDYHRVDTITFVDKATNSDVITFPYCEFGLADPLTQLVIRNKNDRTSRNLDRTLRIDCIILEPVE